MYKGLYCFVGEEFSLFYPVKLQQTNLSYLGSFASYKRHD